MGADIRRYKSTNYKYYSIQNIKKYKANINLVFSGRSDGKTFSSLSEIALTEYEKSKHKEKFIYVRRQREDFTRGRGGFTFSGVNNEGKVKEITKGKWEKVLYRNSAFWLAKYDEELDKDITDIEPAGYAVPLSESYHLKSSNFDTVTNVIFDEFISPDNIGYLVDEWTIWQNLQSTIIRQRDNVTFWLFGNTIDYLDNPYFLEMGLFEIVEKMEPGDIVVIDAESGLRIALEYAKVEDKSKLSDKFFNFKNSTGEKMITSGEWSYTEYKHLPLEFDFKATDRIARIYLDYKDKLLNINLYLVYDDRDKNNCLDLIAYIENKYSPLKFSDEDIILTDKIAIKHNIINYIHSTDNKLVKKLLDLIKSDKVYYQDNKVGSIFNSYLNSY